MQIKTVHYSALLNLGNYTNEKIGFTAQLEEGETAEQAIERLRQKVREIGGPEAEKTYQELYNGKIQLKELERKIQKATSQWNETAEFLRAQGIKPDSPNMPQFTNLLPDVKEEYTGVVEGEIEVEEEEGAF